jgi:hypothetical protein
VTLKAVRRFLEEDMALPPHTLDGAEHKSVIKAHVDEARRARLACASLGPECAS